MNASFSAELIDELDVALQDGSSEWLVLILQKLSALLLSSGRLSPSQIGIFDDVLVRLLDSQGAHALAELSVALADFAPAPERTVRRLASHENPSVASPLLSKSSALLDTDLIEIGKSRSQQHLAAISSRQNLSEALTDAILKVAGKDATCALAKNQSARFSNGGFAALLAAAAHDERIAEALGLRPDLPAATLQCLLSQANATVRVRLLNAAP